MDRVFQSPVHIHRDGYRHGAMGEPVNATSKVFFNNALLSIVYIMFLQTELCGTFNRAYILHIVLAKILIASI